MYKVEVEIPAGETCLYEVGKPCIMARYTKKWGAYNCRLHNRILKGEKSPRKCKACAKYCKAMEGGRADEEDQDRLVR